MVGKERTERMIRRERFNGREKENRRTESDLWCRFVMCSVTGSFVGRLICALLACWGTVDACCVMFGGLN